MNKPINQGGDQTNSDFERIVSESVAGYIEKSADKAASPEERAVFQHLRLILAEDYGLLQKLAQ